MSKILAREKEVTKKKNSVGVKMHFRYSVPFSSLMVAASLLEPKPYLQELVTTHIKISHFQNKTKKGCRRRAYMGPNCSKEVRHGLYCTLWEPKTGQLCLKIAVIHNRELQVCSGQNCSGSGSGFAPISLMLSIKP